MVIDPGGIGQTLELSMATGLELDVPNKYTYVHSDTLLNTYKTKHQTGNELQICTHDNRLP